jgi:hypothetical protein
VSTDQVLLLACMVLASAGLVQLVRAVPWVHARMLDGKKPWVCDACMSLWGSLLTTGAVVHYFWSAVWWAALPVVFFACLWVTKRLNPVPVSASIL